MFFYHSVSKVMVTSLAGLEPAQFFWIGTLVPVIPSPKQTIMFIAISFRLTEIILIGTRTQDKFFGVLT
jgi:hypothetical protein